MANRPDWDLAIIAAVGGAALMAYVTQARLSAEEAERALREAEKDEGLQRTLADLLFSDENVAVVLLDRDGRIVTASKGVLDGLRVADVRGMLFEDLLPMSREHWREAFNRALNGRARPSRRG
ncbi:MAG: PAS domain-containing protein [Hyphomonadaceae bacterium]